MLTGVFSRLASRAVSVRLRTPTVRPNKESVRTLVLLPRPVALQPFRTIVYTDTGALLERPERVKFGLVKIFLCVVTFTYLGAMMSKTGAAILEETELFVPSDDDDDDD